MPDQPDDLVTRIGEAGNPIYAVRLCRGHWHVTCCGEDLAVVGDPFASEAEAQQRAAVLNAQPSAEAPRV